MPVRTNPGPDSATAVNDVLLTSSGVPISGALCAHAFRLIDNVEVYQVVQRRAGQVIVRIVRGPAFDPSNPEEPKVRNIFGKYLGLNSQIAISTLLT